MSNGSWGRENVGSPYKAIAHGSGGSPRPLAAALFISEKEFL